MKKYLALTPVALAVLLTGCNLGSDETTNIGREQPELVARTVDIIEVDGYKFKDLNNNGKLDAYEDWRLSDQARIDDLVRQMTLEEKVGMLLIDTLNSAPYGKIDATHVDYVHKQMMNRFIFRNAIKPLADISDEERESTGRSGATITVFEAAEYMNRVQELSESTRLGIPSLFKSNARNHLDPMATMGINVSSGAFSAWPKEAGLAATRDMQLIGEFSEVMRQEWKAVGLRGMYGYMADLATEPRWNRVHETFTEDSDLASDIMTTLVTHLQGKQVDGDSVVLTMKHFPGGGPQFLGFDPHYIAGQHQTYPSDMTEQYQDGSLEYHYRPFKAAIDAGVAALMPYYGIAGGGEWSINNPDSTNLDVGGGQTLGDVVSEQVKDTVRVPNNTYSTTVGEPAGNVGIAFSKGILDDLLRQKLGFTGVINSDTGIIGEPNSGETDVEAMQNNRAWGLQDKTKAEQLVVAIEAGTDVFSGFHSNAEIRQLVEQGLVSEARIDQSVKRLLKVQFELGLFENPYVDPVQAQLIVGNEGFMEKGRLAQRKSVTLLKNEQAEGAALLPLPASSNGQLSLYTLGMQDGVVEDYGYHSAATAADADYAVLRVTVQNKNTGWLIFGGALFNEVDVLDFSSMATSESWDISPSLEEIKAVMSQVGADNTVLSVYFRQPFVMDPASGMNDAGAVLATYGSQDDALMDVLTGKFKPAGKLPFALANSAQAIIDQASDAPGYPEKDTLYPFGHGLSY